MSVPLLAASLTRANNRHMSISLFPQIHQSDISGCAKSDVHVPLVESNVPSGVEFPLFVPFGFAMHKRFKHTEESRFGKSKSMEKPKNQGGWLSLKLCLRYGLRRRPGSLTWKREPDWCTTRPEIYIYLRSAACLRSIGFRKRALPTHSSTKLGCTQVHPYF